MSMCWYICLRLIFMFQIIRNKAKRQAYQQEYAREKRAPGRQKVSKVERAQLEDKHWHKSLLWRMVGPRRFMELSPKTAPPLCVSRRILPADSFYILSFGTHTVVKGLQMRAYSALPTRGSST